MLQTIDFILLLVLNCTKNKYFPSSMIKQIVILFRNDHHEVGAQDGALHCYKCCSLQEYVHLPTVYLDR